MVIQTTRSSATMHSAATTGMRSNANIPGPKPHRTRNPIRTAPPLDLGALKLDSDPAFEVPKQSRPMGLQEAPTYWPTEKEWTDPIGYIQSIADEGKKYGIVKVYILLHTIYILEKPAYKI